MSSHDDTRMDANLVGRNSNAKLVGDWLVRWSCWLYLVARESPDLAPDAAIKSALFCSLGTTALILPLLGCLVTPPYYALLGIVIGVFAYLAIGLVAFFTSPITNAPIHWTKNGAW